LSVIQETGKGASSNNTSHWHKRYDCLCLLVLETCISSSAISNVSNILLRMLLYVAECRSSY
jgi:hypothetical protein